MDSRLVFCRDRVILNQWQNGMIGLLMGFQKRLSYGVFPSDKRSWTFRTKVKHSMESAHQFSSGPDCNNTAAVPSFTLRTALSAIPFVSDLCGVDVQWFQERSSQTFANSRNCRCKWLQVSYSAPRTFASSFVFPEKFLFCKDLTGSIKWPSPAPRLHVDDCFEIHNFHWGLCDLLLSSHRNFQHKVRLRQGVFCTGPLWFWSSDRSRNFGL